MPKRNVDDLTDDEITLFLERAQSSGMTEAQIEKAALTQGYTAADIAKMRERISTVNEKDPYEKNNKTEENSLIPSKVIPLSKPRRGPSNTSERRYFDPEYDIKPSDSNPNIDIYEKETPLTLDERKLLANPLNIYNDSLVIAYNKLKARTSRFLDKKIFGTDLFNNKYLTFEPDMRIATPKSYQLGPDDELDIHIFGDVLDNFKVKISPTNCGAIFYTLLSRSSRFLAARTLLALRTASR